MPKESFVGRTFVALLGLFLVFISSIVLFVTTVEYDPVGKELRRSGEFGSGTVLLEDKPMLLFANGNSLPLARSEGLWNVNVGDVLYGYYDTKKFIPEQMIPHVPRSWDDFGVPLLMFVCSVVLLSFDPRVLYIDMLQPHD